MGSEKARKADLNFNVDRATHEHEAGSGNPEEPAASSSTRSSAAEICPDTRRKWLHEALGLSATQTPFPWQEELLAHFVKGMIESSIDIPTGLGKTGVMAVWLVARALGAPLPRRLVYVVDRRAVVDQATEVARGLRDCVDRDPQLKEALGLGERSLPISTLRGQYVDNREWLEDPASPAVIVGTVDMIGSRLLFEGYGISRKMRPYHAGLLGADSLVVLDEAHLVPPFEKLLHTVASEHGAFGPREKALRDLVPPFRLLSLSATGRSLAGEAFGLQDADLKHPEVIRRLEAPKRLTVLPPIEGQTKLEEALAAQVWQLVGDQKGAVRCIVFCDKRVVAVATLNAIKKLDKNNRVATSLFVGGRRVLEREEAAKDLKELGFIAGVKVGRSQPAVVFATSAGEVGVDLDADHMVSDLVAWERMVQRLGRVNRRGEGKADVIVVLGSEQKPKKTVQEALTKDPSNRSEEESKAVSAFEAPINRTRAVCRLFDRLPPHELGGVDASPGALRGLRLAAGTDTELQAILNAATTPAPLRPALSRALVDAWSMTSLREHTGRPEINPWLRGWVEGDPPQTAVVWRKYLPLRKAGKFLPSSGEIEAFFEAAPPHASEILETETYRVVEWLIARARSLTEHSTISNEAVEGNPNDDDPIHMEDIAAIVLTPAGDFSGAWKLRKLALGDDTESKKIRDALESKLVGATLIVDARIAGLHEGLLDQKAVQPARTIDDGAPWMSTTGAGDTHPTSAPDIRFRVRPTDAGQSATVDPLWRERLRFASDLSEDGEPTHWLIIEKWCHDAATEEDRSAGRPQMLDEHQSWTENRARKLALRLGLPNAYSDTLAVAARLHDEGKKTRRWQRAFNAKSDGVYAKTRGPLNARDLDGYRHEFGSLRFVEKDTRFCDLPDDLRDLALHLIAAHHGFARPLISADGCEDAPPSALEERAEEVALRFARLQKRWGPWGLAWWEALMRAADQQASRDNDSADSAVRKENL